MTAKEISTTATRNTTISAIALTRRTLISGRATDLFLTLAVAAAFAPYAAHVLGDGFGDFFGHETRSRSRLHCLQTRVFPLILVFSAVNSNLP
jgi:hypothetical protein